MTNFGLISTSYLGLCNNADLEYSQLENGNFRRSFLENAKLSFSDFRGAQMTEATLDFADISGAHFSPATSLDGASLRGTRFENVNLEQAGNSNDDFAVQLSKAFGDATVKLPEGLNHGEPPLEHWSPDILDAETFEQKCREFRETLTRSDRA